MCACLCVGWHVHAPPESGLETRSISALQHRYPRPGTPIAPYRSRPRSARSGVTLTLPGLSFWGCWVHDRHRGGFRLAGPKTSRCIAVTCWRLAGLAAERPLRGGAWPGEAAHGSLAIFRRATGRQRRHDAAADRRQRAGPRCERRSPRERYGHVQEGLVPADPGRGGALPHRPVVGPAADGHRAVVFRERGARRRAGVRRRRRSRRRVRGRQVLPRRDLRPAGRHVRRLGPDVQAVPRLRLHRRGLLVDGARRSPGAVRRESLRLADRDLEPGR